MATVNKRKRISIDQKVAIIEAVNAKVKTNAEICRQFDVPSSTLYTILKDKDKILEAQGQFCGDRKKIRRPDFAKVDQALLLWFKQARSKNVPISSPILLAKGKEIAEGLGLSDLVLSASWLDRFKLRHGIAMKFICGESSSVNQDITDDWKATHLKKILEEYRPCDIFNADETGLFYKCLPSRTLTTKGETCSGGKSPKDRITLLVAANMDGSEKLPLLAIGKHQRPRCLKNIKSLPTEYKAFKKAWMTSALFEEWLRRLDSKLLLQGRSIAMIVDNCTAHPHIKDLKAVELVFLPPNTTSILQPCDQGIIQALKTHYRKQVLKSLIASLAVSDNANCHLKLTLLDALAMAASAWDEIKPEVIANCFRHAGFTKETETETLSDVDDGRKEAEALFSKLPGDQGSVDDFLTIDERIETMEELTTSEIVNYVASQEKKSTEDDADDETEAIPSVSLQAALHAVTTLCHYLLQQENGSDLLKDMDRIQNFVDNTAINRRKQSTISAFFKPAN